MNCSISSLRLAAPTLAALLLTASSCFGAFFNGTGRLPTPNVPYQLVNPPPPPAVAGSVTIHSFEVEATKPAEVEYPTFDSENGRFLLDSMFSVDWNMQLSVGLGPVFPAFGEGQMHVVGSAPISPLPGPHLLGQRVYQLELVQLDLLPSEVADPVIPVMLRESPTQTSTGVITVEDLCPVCAAIVWRVDSFFDVFAEISLDGGQTWTPTAGPMHIVQVPEPTALALLLCGLVCIRRVR